MFMNKEDFIKLQKAQLEIMDEIHRVCVKCGIGYYMIGGTLLGAVRHGGFIPWDLDIDIAMKRSDYDAFKTACQTELNSRFCYLDYKNTPDFDHPHALICIKNTVLVNKFDKYNPSKKNLGIYLDIFPLDYAPDDPKLQDKQEAKLLRIKKLKKLKVGTLYQENFLKKAVKSVIKRVIFWTTVNKLNENMDACMRQYNESETGYLCSMASHYSYKKQCMPKKIYGTPKLLGFENRMYYAPEMTEEYLTRIYKDYMKLPPESERNSNLEAFERVEFEK